jgi:hypothetical protein
MHKREILDLWKNYNICVGKCFDRDGERWVVYNDAVIGKPCFYIEQYDMYVCKHKDFFFVNTFKPTLDKLNTDIIAYKNQIEWIRSFEEIIDIVTNYCVKSDYKINNLAYYFCRSKDGKDFKLKLFFNMAVVSELSSTSFKSKYYTSKDELKHLFTNL